MSVSFDAALAKMRAERPLVHVISNYVTLNDVVNVILAAGAAAIAADDPQETAQITEISRALYLNTGMPSERKQKAMTAAGKAANAAGIPVVLDPVGAGASDYRKDFLEKLLRDVHITCIRGNAAEIAALSGVTFRSRGVESADIFESEASMQQLSDELHCIVAVSGKRDLVVTPDAVRASETGSALARRVTGCGCMLSGLIAAFLALYPDASMQDQAALVHAVMKQYGLAQQEAQKCADGTMAFRNKLINVISRRGYVMEQA